MFGNSDTPAAWNPEGTVPFARYFRRTRWHVVSAKCNPKGVYETTSSIVEISVGHDFEFKNEPGEVSSDELEKIS